MARINDCRSHKTWGHAQRSSEPRVARRHIPESTAASRKYKASVPGVRPLPPLAVLNSVLRLLSLLLRRWVHCRPEDSLVRQQDLIGLTGQVLLSCSRDQRGVVRLRVRDTWIDARAYGDDARPLLRGDRALVLLHQDNHLWVTRLADRDGEDGADSTHDPELHS